MRVTQVIGMPVGKASLVPKPPGKRKGKQRGAWTETGEEAEERVARKRQRLVDAVPAPRTRPARAGHHLQGHRGRLRRDRGRRGRPLRSHRRHRPLARCRRRGDHRPAAAQAGRHRTDGRRHHRQACHRRAYGPAARDDPRRPAGRADHQAQDLCRAGSRDDPAGRHRGGHRAGRRAGPGRQPDGRQPGRGLT